MEDKNELSDIVLEKDDTQKSQKFKRILIGAAVTVLVFLVVLIVMRAINKPQTEQNDSRLVLPPEPTVKEQTTTEPKDDQLFKQVPIIEEESKKESFEDMVKKLKEKEIKRIDVKKDVLEPAKKEIKQEVKKVVNKVNKVATIDKAMVEETTKTIKQVAQNTIKVPKKIVSTSKTSKNATSGTYIQIGATSKTKPDARYLKSIEKKSYDYKLYKVNIKGKTYTKILIGPFDSRNDAKNSLPKVKKDFNPNAFIFRVP